MTKPFNPQCLQCKSEISYNLSKNLYHLTNAHTITATTALKEQRGRSNDGNEALFGRAWASPTLVGLQCKTRVYACMYVCLCMAGFSKVFDSVSHQCFLLKLDSVWIRGHILAWIGSFLTNCRRRVLLDGCSSERVNVCNFWCTAGGYSWTVAIHNLHQ